MITNTIFRRLILLSIVFLTTIVSQNREGFTEGNLTDGPYVFYKSKSVIVKKCLPNGDQMQVTRNIYNADEKEKVVLECKKAGFEAVSFSFKLKPELKIPEWEYPESDKIFTISDIEGNFTFFTKMLRTAGVIDEKFNWTFGNGHLVLIGDIFDRGIHITECLWLLYSLEEKAKEFGGNVHVMFGNHDMMNLRGDLRYVENKYKLTSDALGISYRELFGIDSELGRWLRTKNSIIKIGKKLFVHGGLSQKLIEKKLSISDINDKMRDLMYIPHRKESDQTLKLLAGSFGPMWYRGYFMDYKDRYKRVNDKEVDEILDYFGGEQIYVGHTIVDKPEAMYNGKVIAVDVKHTADHKIEDPENISWGVLIQKNKIIRIDLYNNREDI